MEKDIKKRSLTTEATRAAKNFELLITTHMNSINMPLVLVGAFLVLLVIIKPSHGRYGRRNGLITLVILIQSLFFLAGLALVLLGLNSHTDLMDLLPDSF